LINDVTNILIINYCENLFPYKFFTVQKFYIERIVNKSELYNLLVQNAVISVTLSNLLFYISFSANRMFLDDRIAIFGGVVYENINQL